MCWSSYGIPCIEQRGARKPLTPPHHGRLGPKGVRDIGLVLGHCPARLGMQQHCGGNGMGTMKGKKGSSDSGLIGLESFIIKSPVTLQQKAPHRLEAANKTTTLCKSRPLLTSSFEKNLKCATWVPNLK